MTLCHVLWVNLCNTQFFREAKLCTSIRFFSRNRPRSVSSSFRRATLKRRNCCAAPSTTWPRRSRLSSRAENDDYAEKVGIHWATAQALDLLDNDVKGIHFYTLNQSKAALHIYEWLGVSSSQALGEGRGCAISTGERCSVHHISIGKLGLWGLP